MTKEKKYTLSRNHGEYCTGIYETRIQALQVWWEAVQDNFSMEEIEEILAEEGLSFGSITLGELYDLINIDSEIMEVYI